MRKKEGRGGRSDEESEKMKKLQKNEKKKSLKDASLASLGAHLSVRRSFLGPFFFPFRPFRYSDHPSVDRFYIIRVALDFQTRITDTKYFTLLYQE